MNVGLFAVLALFAANAVVERDIVIYGSTPAALARGNAFGLGQRGFWKDGHGTGFQTVRLDGRR